MIDVEQRLAEERHERQRIARGSDDKRRRPCPAEADALGHLRERDVDLGLRFGIEAVVTDVADDPDDLGGCGIEHLDAAPDRPAAGEELTRGRLAHDNHRRRRGGVLGDSSRPATSLRPMASPYPALTIRTLARGMLCGSAGSG